MVHVMFYTLLQLQVTNSAFTENMEEDSMGESPVSLIGTFYLLHNEDLQVG